MKGSIISVKKDNRTAILQLLKNGLEKKCFDALLLPVKVPAGDSFAYLLIEDPSLLDNAYPLPPVMPVQGARALSSLTRLGSGKKRIAVVMRPCEIRATIELYKLEQVKLENTVLISIDCPGALPLSGFVDDPDKGIKIFDDSIREWKSEVMRPICQICTEFSMVSSDLHIGTLSAKQGTLFLIPASPRGKEIVEALGMKNSTKMDSWENKVKEITVQREKKKKVAQEELRSTVTGLDELFDAFRHCITCRNCMRVCPVCYCRQCYFDSDKIKYTFEDYFIRARNQTSLRFLPDTILFHIGRMSHIGSTCVSCGACEDACPMDIPVGRIYSMVAEEVRELFDYLPGRNREEPHPLATYKEEELQEIED